jgi:membrane-associated phospholipid phosphatase
MERALADCRTTTMTAHRKACLALATWISTHAGTVRAQVGVGSERQDFRNFLGDIWSVWSSPAHMTRRDIAPTVGAIAGVALSTQVDSTVRVWLLAHERSGLVRALAPVRDSSPTIPAGRLGMGLYLLPLSGAAYVAGRVFRWPDVRDAGMGCAAGHLSVLGIREVAYHAIGRGRPRITADPFLISIPESGGWLWHSFFSGHIANSMACASYLGHRFSFGAAEALPYAFSAAIGIGRMADGEHWTSDTVIGGVVGYAIGQAIAKRQLARNDTSSSTTIPTARSRGRGWPLVSWSFDF